ncbi:MAG: nitroreductase family protein [Pirellulales bacterium]|nr:nitroreductase family protein [Pirellulales bacterium]
MSHFAERRSHAFRASVGRPRLLGCAEWNKNGKPIVSHAEATHIHDLLRRRWSPRAFEAHPVEPEQLAALFEAARWAPSCYNEQPWAFLVTSQRQHDDFARALDTLVEFNQLWARHAPVLALSFARLTFARNGQPNNHAWYDVGQAVAHLTFQATALGLYVHQMAGFDASKVRRNFRIPDGWEPVTAIAIGSIGDPESLVPKLRDPEIAPRSRKPLAEVVFSGDWQADRLNIVR